jgi:hypothetical protein
MKNAVFWDVSPCGFLRTDLLEERIASINRVTRIGESGTTLALTSNRRTLRRMASSGMLRRAVLVRTDVSEERSACFIRVTIIGELGRTVTATSN